MSIGGSGGTAVKSATLVATPFGLAVVGCCGPRCFCAVLPDGIVPDVCPRGMYTYVFWVGAVLYDRFTLFVSNLFLFRRPPPMPLSDTA